MAKLRVARFLCRRTSNAKAKGITGLGLNQRPRWDLFLVPKVMWTEEYCEMLAYYVNGT